MWKAALAALTLWGAAPVLGQPANGGLKDVYANHFRFGNIFNGNTVNNNSMKTIVFREFNSITPENELKPDATLLQSGSTNTDVKVQLSNGARNILKFCQDNNIAVRGHTLVWHSQTPEWFFKEGFNASGAVVTPAVMDQRMESYIKNMFALIKSNYPTLNLYAYDVVNEASSESGGPRAKGSNTGSGQSMWVQVYGDNSFIEKAFTYARKYAPATTKLFYNDYNEYIQAKRDYIANSIVKPLKEKGLIDGVGMQSHLDVKTGNDAYPSATLYGQAITIYKNLGVEIHVSELDATISDGNESYFSAQATYYKNIMSEILNKGGSAVTAVVVWGIQDNQSWRSSRKPLLFDGSGNKKAAYTELVKLIPQSEWGDGSNPGVVNPPPTTSVAAGAAPSRAPFSVNVRGKTLFITAASPAVVGIYNVKGGKEASVNVSGVSQPVKLSLPNGMYFARARGLRDVKFVVR
jgi:GH35 family endo-1,4-beta-xylanase